MCDNTETAQPAVVHPPGISPGAGWVPLCLLPPNLPCTTVGAPAKGKGVWSLHALAQVRTALVPSVDLRVATQTTQLLCHMPQLFGICGKIKDKLTIVTGFSPFPVLLGGPNNPLNSRNGTVQHWARAGFGWLLRQAEMLFSCAQQREQSWKPKSEGAWASKGEEGPRRIFISLIFCSLLLVRKTFMRVLLLRWYSRVFVTTSVKEKQTVLNLSAAVGMVCTCFISACLVASRFIWLNSSYKITC